MDIQRQAFEKEYNKHHPNDMATRLQNGNYSGWVKQASWEMWQQAQKVAVPEGFVLVKNVHPDSIVHNQGLGLFRECMIIYGWKNKSDDFKDALNKGFYHGLKLGVRTVLEKAMIEAQEQKG